MLVSCSANKIPGIAVFRLKFSLNRALGCLLLLGALPSAHAAESYDSCIGFITSIPAVIATQGTWCLKQDLATAMTAGNAITINTNNVTINCNDFKLGDLAAGSGTATIGIYATNRQNVTVRRCNIRGFYRGILIFGTGGGHVAEDNRLYGNTSIGMWVAGDGSVVRRNIVSDTGGSTYYQEGENVFGIYTQNEVDVVDNTVSGVWAIAVVNPYGNATGIHTSSDDASSIIGNRVRGLAPVGEFGFAYGISNFVNGRLAIRDNDVIGGGNPGSGMLCTNGGLARAKGNVINGFITGLNGCVDDGNVIAP